MKRNILLITILLYLTTGFTILFAHCDSVEGPVVKASQKALETGNINYVLVWVQAKDEKEIKEMFDNVNKVRSLRSGSKRTRRYVFL